jgi:hypothetical protein
MENQMNLNLGRRVKLIEDPPLRRRAQLWPDLKDYPNKEASQEPPVKYSAVLHLDQKPWESGFYDLRDDHRHDWVRSYYRAENNTWIRPFWPFPAMLSGPHYCWRGLSYNPLEGEVK